MEKEKLGMSAAFPYEKTCRDGLGHEIKWHEDGMSKRFYAACAAMQGVLASGIKITTENLIIWSYKAADELLKQEKKNHAKNNFIPRKTD